MSAADTTPLTAEQLAALLRHSRRAVARTAGELSYAASRGAAEHREAWRTFRRAWCELFKVSPRTADDQIQELLWEVDQA